MRLRLVERLDTVRHHRRSISFDLCENDRGYLEVRYVIGDAGAADAATSRSLLMPIDVTRLVRRYPADERAEPILRLLSSDRFLYLFRYSQDGYIFVHRYVLMELLGRTADNKGRGRVEPFGSFAPTIPRIVQPPQSDAPEQVDGLSTPRWAGGS